MGEKDINEKLLEDYNDVFADIVNVLVFDGEQRLNEDSLVPAQEHSVYHADGKFHEQERDTSKYWKNGNATISMIGLGNQSTVDKDSALRVIGYDGAAYRAQLYLEKDQNGNYHRNSNPRYPVVTLILYFGEGMWSAPKTLKESLLIPNGMEKFVSDYNINVFEIRNLTRDQVDKFKSDFWFVADYFYQVENNKDYVPNDTNIKHVEAVMRLLSVFENDDRFLKAFNQAEKEGKGDENMSSIALDKAEDRGFVKGDSSRILSVINNTCLTLNCTPERACEIVGISMEDYQKAKEIAGIKNI